MRHKTIHNKKNFQINILTNLPEATRRGGRTIIIPLASLFRPRLTTSSSESRSSTRLHHSSYPVIFLIRGRFCQVLSVQYWSVNGMRLSAAPFRDFLEGRYYSTRTKESPLGRSSTPLTMTIAQFGLRIGSAPHISIDLGKPGRAGFR
jgi:hypothetical protein